MKMKCTKLLQKIMMYGGSIDLVQPTEMMYNPKMKKAMKGGSKMKKYNMGGRVSNGSMTHSNSKKK